DVGVTGPAELVEEDDGLGARGDALESLLWRVYRLQVSGAEELRHGEPEHSQAADAQERAAGIIGGMKAGTGGGMSMRHGCSFSAPQHKFFGVQQRPKHV